MSTADAVARRPLTTFFGAAYLLSLVALVALGLPKLQGSHTTSSLALVVFPIMVIGIGSIGLALTRIVSGQQGLRDLRDQFRRPVSPAWYTVLLIPPVAILAVLLMMNAFVSSNFAPNFFVFGIAAGLLAGFCEELGWTGFAYPRMRTRFGPLLAAIVLGVAWGLWHLPVVDSLGAASPHGSAFIAFFVAFVVLLTAVRVLIAWVYDNTGSLRMAQLVHASSTGFLVILSAPRVTPSQEADWYFVYALLLWIIVLALRSYPRIAARRQSPRLAAQ
jgi:membrane protease YdiL (CAAX protease family)